MKILKTVNILVFLMLGFCFQLKAEGPLFTQKDTYAQQEFDNVYQNLRKLVVSSGTLPSGSTQYIQNGTAFQTGAVFNVSSGTVGSLNATGTTLPQISIYPASGNSQLSLIATGNAANSNFINFSNNTSGAVNQLWGIGQAFVETGGELEFRNRTVGANSIIFRLDGSVNQPLQPSFLATDGTGATDVTGDGTNYTELWPTEVYDQGADFASNTFTAPVTGKYSLSANVRINGILVTHTVRLISITTSNREYDYIFSELIAETTHSLGVAAIADMDANDTATVIIQVAGSTKVVDVNNNVSYNFFLGSLIN